MEAMLSEFDYFNPPVLQSTIEGEYDHIITPVNVINTVAGDALGNIEFNIPASPDLYRDLSNSFLMLRLKVVDNVGGNLLVGDVISPVNLLAHSLFSNVSLVVEGKDVTEKDSLYPYRSYMETLLTYDQDVLKTRAIVEGWQKDDAGRMNNITLVAQQNQPDPNTGFVERRKMIAQSRAFTLFARPHLDLFHQQLDIPASVKMTLKLTPSTVAFAFMGAGALANVKVLVLDARLYVKTKKVCNELILAHRQMLEETTIKIPHNRVTVSKYGIAQGFTSSSITLNYPAKLPKRIVLGFVLDAAVTGAIGENPFNFQNFGVTKLGLKVNGKSVPAEPLSMDYATGDYQRAYINTLGALSLDVENRAISLTPAEFSQGFNLYAFKVAPGPIDGQVISAANTNGSIVVDITFAQGLAANVDMIVYSESPAVLEIDRSSGVTLI